MTKEEIIIDLARNAQVHEELCNEHFIHVFAKLIAEKEREDLCKYFKELEDKTKFFKEKMYLSGVQFAIRARGQE